MRVEGELAKSFKAVRLDSMTDINRGELVMADDISGEVVYKDATGEEKRLTLGQHMIHIIPIR